MFVILNVVTNGTCTDVKAGTKRTFSLSVLIWMALGMSFAVFSLVIEVTSFSRMVILKDRVQFVLNKPLDLNITLYSVLK